MKEHDHIKAAALRFFGVQFNKQLNPADFAIICVPKKADYPLAFEIFTTRIDDFLRLRVYLQITSSDNFQPFKLEVTTPYVNNSPEDEVWVTLGSLDKYHIESGYLKEDGLYRCPDMVDNILLMEDGNAILAEDGSYILME